MPVENLARRLQLDRNHSYQEKDLVIKIWDYGINSNRRRSSQFKCENKSLEDWWHHLKFGEIVCKRSIALLVWDKSRIEGLMNNSVRHVVRGEYCLWGGWVCDLPGTYYIQQQEKKGLRWSQWFSAIVKNRRHLPYGIGWWYETERKKPPKTRL